MGRVYWHQRNPQHQLDTSARAGFNIPHDEKRVQRTTLMLPIIETSKYGAFIPRRQFKCQLDLHWKEFRLDSTNVRDSYRSDGNSAQITSEGSAV